MRIQPAIDARTGDVYVPVRKRGTAVLKEPLLNKGTAFTEAERDALGLQGLLPAHTSTMEEQLQRVLQQFRGKATPLEQHIYLAALHDRNETLFYRFVMENLEEAVPIIYTPTVAEACRHWSQIFRRSRGIYVTPQHRGRVVEVLRHRDIPEASVIVVTDNSRILGIGDQGAGGMGIPIGKLALYTVAAGINPAHCVPISLDVGTDNAALLADPLYLGWRQPRLVGEPYRQLVEELVTAVREVFPGALLQWEDFSNRTSFENLDRYRDVLPSFNDDIQGTAAMVVGGLLAALRRDNRSLADETYVVAGAGSAGIGIAELLAAAIGADAAGKRVFVTDSRGLLLRGREGVTGRKQAVAAEPGVAAGWGGRIDLQTVVERLAPSVLIGVSGIPGLFTRSMIESTAGATERPVVMPLSNPTANTEALPADILHWSSGRAVVATGSPFPDVEWNGRRRRIGQANNVFVFPGVGLGTVISGARNVTDGMFLAAARALAASVSDADLDAGAIYPPMRSVRDVSRAVARAVAEAAIGEEVAGTHVDIEADLAAAMWSPVYLPYRAV